MSDHDDKKTISHDAPNKLVIPRLYEFPNPDKALGDCYIEELKEALKKRKIDKECVDPQKRLCDCSIEELEEQIRIINERQAAAVYPIPEKKLRDCGIQELEDQLGNVEEAKANAPKVCHLPMIPETIFCDVIMNAFLTNYCRKRVLQTKEVSQLYGLSDHFCQAHAHKLEKDQKSEAATGKRKRLVEALPDPPEEWKAKNPSPNPEGCNLCKRASEGLECCSRCDGVERWNQFVQCVTCRKRLCSSSVLCQILGDCKVCTKDVCLLCGSVCPTCGETRCERHGCYYKGENCRYCGVELCSTDFSECTPDHLMCHMGEPDPGDY